MKLGKLFNVLALPIAVGSLGILYFLEKRRPLRPESKENEAVHLSRNLAISALTVPALLLVEKPVTDYLTKRVETDKFGLLKLFKLPKSLEITAGVLLLDYTLYLWHVLTHRIPFLWRFHIVHHADLDMDSSTAARFHFGEIFISVIWRAMQISIIGVSPQTLKIWQSLLLPSVFFHHSNLKLNENFENILSKVITTPRLHSIHHSVKPAETNSNWSSGLTIWDRLHKTLKTDVTQAEIIIGIEGLQDENDVTLRKMLKHPFEISLTAGSNKELV